MCRFAPHFDTISYGSATSKGSLVQRADFPVSEENVRVADKRGAGPAGLSAQLTEGLLPPYGRYTPKGTRLHKNETGYPGWDILFHGKA